jgi:archaellum component FlaC
MKESRALLEKLSQDFMIMMQKWMEESRALLEKLSQDFMIMMQKWMEESRALLEKLRVRGFYDHDAEANRRK